jgi:hypothetical protein
MTQLTLIVGDWSGDGHDKTTRIMIESNLTLEDVEAAFKNGSELIGFDFTKECCADYEETDITNHIKKIKTLFTKDELKGDRLEEEFDISPHWQNKDEFIIGVDGFVGVYLRICKLGNKQFQYKKIEENESITIGGYGLFY